MRTQLLYDNHHIAKISGQCTPSPIITGILESVLRPEFKITGKHVTEAGSASFFR
jgi:hypothetical protein